MNRQPNILFILSDDHAAPAISCYSGHLNQTPAIDRIANEGMRFDHCYCTNSLCAPSRAAILTGTYNHVNGVRTLKEHLDGSQENLAKILGRNGYQTGLYGKWHLGDDPDSRPTGFDDWRVLIGANGQGEYFDPLYRVNGEAIRLKGYATDIITEQTKTFVKERDPDRPFFAMCCHKAPHRTFTPAPRHEHLFDGVDIPEPANLYDDYSNRAPAAEAAVMRVGRDMEAQDLGVDHIPEDIKGAERTRWCYQRYIKQYLRTVAAIDEGIGSILDLLDAEGIAEDTIVVYTSDQGFFLGEHGWFDKRFMYEESLKMPYLMRYPRMIPAGSKCEEMVTNVDFAPTYLELAGIDIPEHMQGRSFAPLLRNKVPSDWPQSMYYRYWTNGTNHNVASHYGVRSKHHKLICYYADSMDYGFVRCENPELRAWEFFDLKEDPNEMVNRINDVRYTETIREMKDTLRSWQDQTGDLPHASEPSLGQLS